MIKSQKDFLKEHSMGMLMLLVLQYVLGMLTNLFVKFPENATVGQNWEYMHGQWLIWAHIAVGLLLVSGIIALYVRAVKQKNKIWKIASGIASVAVVLAFICGEEFISRQQDVLSLAMSLFFIVALASIAWGIYKTRD